MLSLADSQPADRYWLIGARLSEKGKLSLLEWVKQDSLGRNQRFPQRPIENFLGSDPKNWHALFAVAAFANVPLGFQVDYAFSLKNGQHHLCKLALRHVVWQYGIPLERTEHGHKHFLCFEGQAPPDPLWNGLPLWDSHDGPYEGATLGLCAAIDYPFIART